MCGQQRPVATHGQCIRNSECLRYKGHPGHCKVPRESPNYVSPRRDGGRPLKRQRAACISAKDTKSQQAEVVCDAYDRALYSSGCCVRPSVFLMPAFIQEEEEEAEPLIAQVGLTPFFLAFHQ